MNRSFTAAQRTSRLPLRKNFDSQLSATIVPNKQFSLKHPEAGVPKKEPTDVNITVMQMIGTVVRFATASLPIVYT